MTESVVEIKGYPVKVYSFNTVVVGTGAAGLNAADRLAGYGQKDIAIVTEDINAGTSRNTGSDKQTYYKLTLSGGEPDSVVELAKTLFAGQCVDGDHALCEAALSTQCFLRLVELGVPFPRNRYGEYIGYKTDHDPRRRATSAGPYTSRFMTECLERSVREKRIPIFNRLQVIKILTNGNRLRGILCLNLKNPQEPKERYIAFNCKNLVYATGGPAGMYADSVYPVGHYGATGIAFEAGVKGKNLTEWQYGLASLKPRWNVSGTYMQALPKFISTGRDGGEPREFLSAFFLEKGAMLTNVFLKGYQWPFDVRKVQNGSSLIDLLVYLETCLKGRRVFLDYRENPGNEVIDYSTLTGEAREYLERAGATFGTPIQRLAHMNAPAVSFYQEHGVDLYREPLEIALCAQHNNGGLTIDQWWQTNVEGLFAVGEVSASHGVYRPGGAALNAGQVGATRAALYIAAHGKGEPLAVDTFLAEVASSVTEVLVMGEAVLGGGTDNVEQIWAEAAKRMSHFGAAIRSRDGLFAAIAATKKELLNFTRNVKISSPLKLHKVYRLYDVLVCQYVYLNAMADYLQKGGKSRGSVLYTDPDGLLPYPNLPEIFRFTLDDGTRGDQVQEVSYRHGLVEFSWRMVREIPKEDDFFENVWRSFRENGNVY